jgi:uncharacterized protein (TIGR02246 family)
MQLTGGFAMARIRSLSLMIAAVFAASFFAACSQAPAPVDRRKADEAAIRAAGDALGAAFEAKDIEKSLSFYVDDPVLIVPKSPAVIGKDALRKAFQPFMAVRELKASTSGLIIDVAQSGDLAFERGSFTNTVTDANGKTTTDMGKMVLVWKKQADGSWKIAADTNADDQ